MFCHTGHFQAVNRAAHVTQVRKLIFCRWTHDNMNTRLLVW